MDPLISAILLTWASHRDYAKKLVADLSDEAMCTQPVPGVTMNHPAWTLSHLTPYAEVLSAMIQGKPFTDPLNSPFAKGSTPSPNPRDYPTKEKILAAYLLTHDALAATLQHATAANLCRPIPLARWEQRFPTILDALLYITLSHEATHLGQISMWRRAGGRPAV